MDLIDSNEREGCEGKPYEWKPPKRHEYTVKIYSNRKN